ncbi:MAG TPA: ABC transporter ATP-binding protein [Thermomicrobiales bacterium]|nr:ABC transporter ATP-binding protein [Thermomicrobiales bacterium]
MVQLHADRVALAYDARPVVHDFNLEIEEGKVTTIIGPNGCGKSTVLKSMARLLRPTSGAVYLDGSAVHSMPTREVARQVGLLSQSSELPEGVTVEDLVQRGRYPHQAFLQPPSKQDTIAVNRAIELAGMGELRHRPVNELSGGQRQRAWIAMVLAQETPILLLDEPTTYLDLSHQLEVMELVERLNREEGRTIVMVLHDINEAARVSHRIVAMRDGRIMGDGTPAEVLTSDILSKLFGVDCDLIPMADEVPSCGFCMPRSRAGAERRDTGISNQGFEISRASTGYGKSIISSNLTMSIPGGMITALVGPNACGKSTLMRTCARLQKLGAGTIHLDGRSIASGTHKELARRLALLSQDPTVPGDVLVEDLVLAGRSPHQGFLRRWTAEDEAIVDWAIRTCGLVDLRFRPLGSLSGGQRQRAWIAMSLVQDTDVLLLDEPTTFLDIASQVDLLDIIWKLNREQGKTVVMVIHDINLAARYADHIIAMRDGKVIAQGTPTTVVTCPLMRLIFDIESDVLKHPELGTPLMIPLRASTGSIAGSEQVQVESLAVV